MMAIMKKNRLIILFFIIINCIILLSANYIIANDIEDAPYKLSRNAIVLQVESSSNEKNNGFDFLNMNKDITVIAETNDKSVIGLYDPSMKYYINSTKFVNPTIFRYFSEEDYNNNHKVGIVIDSIDRIMQKDLTSINYSNLEDFYDIDIINIFDTNSLIAEENTRVVMNLFSIEPSKIKTIYIDSYDSNKLEELKNGIKKCGYAETSIDSNKSILKIVYNSLTGGKYIQLMIHSSIFVFLLSVYIFMIYLSKYDKYVDISRICGASYMDILKLLFMRVCLITILMILVSSVLTLNYLENINKNYMTLFNCFKLQICLVTSYMFVFLVKLFTLFKKSMKIMR